MGWGDGVWPVNYQTQDIKAVALGARLVTSIRDQRIDGVSNMETIASVLRGTAMLNHRTGIARAR